ncbi:Protein SGM1 [Cytospora mali]|uniref:Protein SGM1 n=1 Tax=Cytospora mali TaxID=578113 RepID=A0A194VH97_CYTMA|nr:Protein SGM1 [Valsa mali var. pyri (nom. inval.)]
MSGQGPKSRWGSLLSQAVAGVEARLDTILAEEDAPKPSPSPTPSQQSKPPGPSRSDSTRSRQNDRLQERLARAVAAKQGASKGDGPSAKPTPTSSPRQSLDIPNRSSTDSAAIAPSPQSPKADASPRASQDTERKSLETAEKSTADTEDAPVVPQDESNPDGNAGGATSEVADDSVKASPEAIAVADLQDDRIKQLEKALEELATQQQEETHNYVEQIDALQAKLQYLAREATESARKEAKEAPAGSMEKKLAEKDQQIAGLMEEGKNLASTEQKLRTVIKNLRSKIGENEKEINNVKTSKGKVEQELEAARRRSRRADDLEKYQTELHKRIGQSQKEIDALKSELAGRDRTIADLKAQLQKSAEEKDNLTAKINDEALAKERQRVRELEEEVSDLKVEKDLVADRSKAREHELADKAERAAERARVIEVELKAEIQVMESKLESMRVMAEEVSSGAMGDSQAKLLRQVETLQTQYAIATENWQGIESTLQARISNLEKERDEAQHRESEMRKKAREAALRAKRHEEELEDAKTQIPTIQEDVKAHQSQIEALKKRSEEAEAAAAEAKAELERLKAALAEEKAAIREQDRQSQWIEEPPTPSFKAGSRPESPSVSMPTRSSSTDFLGFGSLSSKFRKHSAPSSNGDPLERYTSRRTSVQPLSRPTVFTGNSYPLPPILSPTIESLPAAPSIHPLERQDTFDSAERSSSPQQIAQDMVSVSTVGAGPSVQLVEKLSAAIRRLETEKVATKEELTRISSQRDEARAEMVALMREVDQGKKAAEEVAKLRAEVAEVNERYETTLELLGEKSELVDELKADVDDVKAMYRDLVERTIK